VSVEELAGWLFERRSDGVRWGLERTETLLAGVGNPHRAFRVLHVGGTNGKGSVAALSAAALRADGRHSVGLYTSPHLVDFRERIQIDGAPIGVDALLASAARLRPAIERSGATFFEATTAIAMLALADAGVGLAVVEVGMGGRLDATNVVRPDAVAISNVGMDHTEFLGDTRQAVATEKAGILKPGVRAITAETGDEALAVLDREASRRRVPLLHLDDVCTILERRTDLGGTRVRVASRFWGEREWWAPLAGLHQARNIVLAAELLALLDADARPSPESLRGGFAAVRWPGRMQTVRLRGTTWVFDVAHNSEGALALGDAIARLDLPRPLVVVAGVLADKPWGEMLPPLLRRADASILTVPDSAPAVRRWDVERAAESLQPRVRSPIQAVPDMSGALERAETLAERGTVLVTGSVHTVGDAMRVLGVSPFAEPSATIPV
jgi:dihydrofolate synthase / folylpolyglutamate synthase